MDIILASLWAKTAQSDDGGWHPLILHMLDVAASADSILAREPEATRIRIAANLGMDWEDARAWILLAVACHDLGKACPGFQCKVVELVAVTGLWLPSSPNTKINHAFVSQIALTELLQKRGWPEDLAELVADSVGCHHGERISPIKLRYLQGDRHSRPYQLIDLPQTPANIGVSANGVRRSSKPCRGCHPREPAGRSSIGSKILSLTSPPGFAFRVR